MTKRSAGLTSVKTKTGKPAEPDICTRLGKRLRGLRERRGWGQVELVAESGLDRSFISKIENGRQEIGLRSLEVLANTFGMTISQFTRGV